MSKKVVIVAAIAGAKGITLYHEDGKETNIALDGWRTREVMERVTPLIKRDGKAEIDLSTLDVHQVFAQKTGGLFSFVREKIASVRSWFKPTAEDEASKGLEAFQSTERVDGHVYGVSADPEDETVVAHIDGKRLPGVDALERHIEHAVETGNTEGVANFMRRCAAVIDKRGHSIQELLNFMRRGDLPIANDGSIIAYKVLNTNGDGKIVDCHSGKVTQRVGSRVVMDEKLVDPSRRTQCSSGLHIARRGYLSHFSGDTIMLVKIAPEDVIAVPVGEPDKMRVAAYHIVALIPAAVHYELRSNRPMTTDSTAGKLLADVIAGNHTPVIEEVRITAAKGGGVVITQLAEEVEVKTGISGEAKALDDKKVVDPRQVIREIREMGGNEEPAAEITKSHVQMISGELLVDGQKVETETAAERRNRIKREKRAAAKAQPSETISEAAATGDMSAAINEAPKEKKVKPKTPEQTAAMTKAADGLAKPLPEKHAAALKLHSEGKSNRQIEAELHICRKTLKKLFDKNGLKPNG